MIWSFGDQRKEPLTINNVYDCIVENEILEPEYVLAQSILETGWYKCKYCSLSRNNIFGFRIESEYLHFSHWDESVEYYRKWQIRKGYKRGENYVRFLKRVGYASDPDYGKKIKSIVRRLRNKHKIGV